jgi:hypothetical protein
MEAALEDDRWRAQRPSGYFVFSRDPVDRLPAISVISADPAAGAAPARIDAGSGVTADIKM